MTSSKRRAVLFAAACAIVVPPSVSFVSRAGADAPAVPSANDSETARELYKQGKELRTRGDLNGALDKLRVAHSLGRTPITGIELARTEVLVNQLVEAREVCLGVARLPLAADETERSASARLEAAKLADELRPRIPSLTIVLDGVPPGRAAVVMLDRSVLSNDTLAEPRKVNPGKHEVTAKMPRGPESTAFIDAVEGQSREVRLRVMPEPPGTPALPEGTVTITSPGTAPPNGGPKSSSQPPTTEGHHGGNGWAVAGFVVAGLGIAVGSITGIVAFSDASTLETKCQNKRCPLDAVGDHRSAVAMSTASTVSFVVGGVGLLTAVLALTTGGKSSAASTGSLAPKPGVTPWLGAGSAGVRGAF